MQSTASPRVSGSSRQGHFRGISRGPGIAALLALVACATPAPSADARSLPAQTGAHELEVLVDGSPAPQFFHAGQSYVLGNLGQRYVLRVWNRSWRRVEAVVSIDGRDVIDGKPADYRGKRGYIIAAGGFVDIEGWRLSGRDAAAFRFSRVNDSYAAKTGSARNVGVIGVALFPERMIQHHHPYRQPPRVYPWGPRAPHESRSEAEPPAPAASGARAGAAADATAAAGQPAPESSSSRGASSDDGISARRRPAPGRPGLGTEFGERITAPVEEVSFVREDRNVPATILGVRYNDRNGLLAIGIDVDGWDESDLRREVARRQAAEPFPISERAYASPPPGWRR